MAFTLSFPGELSGWLKLSDDVVKPDASDAKAIARWQHVVNKLDGIEIKTTVFDHVTTAKFTARYIAIKSDDDETLVKTSEIEFDIMAAGLKAIRGIDGVESMPLDDKLFKALAASRLHRIIASTILKYQELTPEERAAFFTSEQVPTATHTIVQPALSSSGVYLVVGDSVPSDKTSSTALIQHGIASALSSTK